MLLSYFEHKHNNNKTRKKEEEECQTETLGQTDWDRHEET